MPATASVPPWSRAAIATGTRSPTGAKRMAASRATGGASCAPPADAAPSSMARRRASSSRVSTWTSSPLGDGQLGCQVGACAEAVQTKASGRGDVGTLKCAVTDDSGTQQGRCLHVREHVGKSITEGLGRHGVLREAGLPAASIQCGRRTRRRRPRTGRDGDELTTSPGTRGMSPCSATPHMSRRRSGCQVAIIAQQHLTRETSSAGPLRRRCRRRRWAASRRAGPQPLHRTGIGSGPVLRLGIGSKRR
jgi:hypothetical protein